MAHWPERYGARARRRCTCCSMLQWCPTPLHMMRRAGCDVYIQGPRRPAARLCARARSARDRGAAESRGHGRMATSPAVPHHTSADPVLRDGRSVNDDPRDRGGTGGSDRGVDGEIKCRGPRYPFARVGRSHARGIGADRDGDAHGQADANADDARWGDRVYADHEPRSCLEAEGIANQDV